MTRPQHLALALFALACFTPLAENAGAVDVAQRKQQKLIAFPIDTTTPEQALKSHWVAVDFMRKARLELAAARKPTAVGFQNTIGRDPGELLAGDMLAFQLWFDQPKRYQAEEFLREIVEVRHEGASRAIALVRIRNSTPLPTAGVLSAAEARLRRDGEQFKYVLVSTPKGWRLVEMFEAEAVSSPASAPTWHKVRTVPPKEQIRTSVFAHEQ